MKTKVTMTPNILVVRRGAADDDARGVDHRRHVLHADAADRGAPQARIVVIVMRPGSRHPLRSQADDTYQGMEAGRPVQAHVARSLSVEVMRVAKVGVAAATAAAA